MSAEIPIRYVWYPPDDLVAALRRASEDTDQTVGELLDRAARDWLEHAGYIEPRRPPRPDPEPPPRPNRGVTRGGHEPPLVSHHTEGLDEFGEGETVEESPPWLDLYHRLKGPRR